MDAKSEAFRQQAGKGRPKGAINRTTKLAKEAIAQAAEGLGGTDRLVAWAKESPENERVFWASIYTKLIPVQTELTGELDVNHRAAEDADAVAGAIAGLVERARSAGVVEQTHH